MLDATSNFHTMRAAYAKGDFVKAKALIDGLVDVSPLSPEGLGARYLRARGHEDGFFGAIELEEALHDYRVLTDHAQFFGSDGMLGHARVLFAQDPHENKQRVADLLLQAVALDSNIKAMMMLGLVHDEGFCDARTAGTWYLQAYRRGLPWGLRYYARLQAKHRRVVRAVASHAIASITSPILVLMNGVRSPFK